MKNSKNCTKCSISSYFFALLLPLSLVAQEAQSLPCAEDPLYGELDFWLGSWTVYDTAGTEVGKNLIGKALEGCAIIENWTGARWHPGHEFVLRRQQHPQLETESGSQKQPKTPEDKKKKC